MSWRVLSGHADSGDGHDSDGEVAQSIKRIVALNVA